MGKNQDGKTPKKRSTTSALGWILWLLAALILVIIFIANQKRIASNLKTTGFFDRIFGKTPAFVENSVVVDSNEKNEVEPFTAPVSIDLTEGGSSGSDVNGIISQNEAARKNYENSLAEDAIQAANEALAAMEASESAEKEEDDGLESEEPATPEHSVAVTHAPVAASSGPTMKLKLFFMVLNSDGSLSPKEVTREMKKSDSPLTDAVNALIDGPTNAEAGQDCITLLSAGSRLLGASVKNGIATLNFNEEFEFNQYGIEGILGQLQQIVYTATAFPTVESVQFLVEGNHKDFLGEGVSIGSPLSRGSF